MFHFSILNFFSTLSEFWVFCRVKDMYSHVNERSGLKAPLISDEVYDIIMKVYIFNLLLGGKKT